MPNSQMKAVTVMNSGTVTKKPAMKLRRSHCIVSAITAQRHGREQDQPDDDSIPGEGGESRASHHREERLDDRRGRDKRHDEADGDLGRPVGGQVAPHLEQLVGERRRSSSASRGRTRTPRRRSRSRPIDEAPDDRRAGARDARDQRQRLAETHTEGAAEPAPPRRRPPPAGGRTRSTISIDHAAEDERGANHAKALVQHALDEVGQQRARQEHRQDADSHAERKPPRARRRSKAGHAWRIRAR